MGKILRYQSGAVAVYEDPDPSDPDLGPLTTPLSNLSKIQFHSDLFYPRIVSTHTGSGTIPAIGRYGVRERQSLITIAHGLSGSPLAMGTLTATYNDGFVYTYSLEGTAIVSSQYQDYVQGNRTATGSDIFERLSPSPAFLTLTSDATNVYLDCTQVGAYSAGGRYWNGGSYTNVATSVAQPFTYEIHILDLLDSQTTDPTGDGVSPLMELSPDRITMGRRKFDTDDRHIRVAASNDDVMISGETIVAGGAPVNATASTVNHVGTMTMYARNLATYSQVKGSNVGLGPYPSPTETPIQFP